MRPFHLLLALLIVVIWGFNFVVIKLALNEVPPLTLCSIRFFLAIFPAIFFINRPKIPLKLLIGYGITMFALQFTMVFASIYVGLPTGLASLLVQTQAFFTIMLATFILGEEVKFPQILGAVIAFTGIAVVASHTNGNIPAAGFLLILGAAFSWGLGNVISKKITATHVVGLVIWGNLIALPPLLLTTFLIEGITHFEYVVHHLTPLMIMLLAYLVYPTIIFSFAAWSWLLQRYNAAIITPFSLLVPVIGMLSSNLILKEAMHSWEIWSALLVILGLCVNLLGTVVLKRRELKTLAREDLHG